MSRLFDFEALLDRVVEEHRDFFPEVCLCLISSRQNGEPGLVFTPKVTFFLARTKMVNLRVISLSD